MFAARCWERLLVEELGMCALAFVTRPWLDWLDPPRTDDDGWIWQALNCPSVCSGYCVRQMNRILEGAYELGKFLLVSKAVADTQQRMEWARHCYQQWLHAWMVLGETRGRRVMYRRAFHQTWVRFDRRYGNPEGSRVSVATLAENTDPADHEDSGEELSGTAVGVPPIVIMTNPEGAETSEDDSNPSYPVLVRPW